jgi:hypothetical protein
LVHKGDKMNTKENILMNLSNDGYKKNKRWKIKIVTSTTNLFINKTRS